MPRLIPGLPGVRGPIGPLGPAGPAGPATPPYIAAMVIPAQAPVLPGNTLYLSYVYYWSANPSSVDRVFYTSFKIELTHMDTSYPPAVNWSCGIGYGSPIPISTPLLTLGSWIPGVAPGAFTLGVFGSVEQIVAGPVTVPFTIALLNTSTLPGASFTVTGGQLISHAMTQRNDAVFGISLP